MEECEVRPRRALGWLLVGAGVVGMVCGIVPFVITGLRIATGRSVPAEMDWLAHGIESLALSAEWAMLSSGMGACLGVMLLWAGAGWIRGRPWAALVTWVYVLCALMVNIPDMTLFICLARPGAMRTQMLVYDGIATGIPAALGLWLWLRRKPSGVKVLGWALVLVGVIGVIGGLIPLTSNALRVLVNWELWNKIDLDSQGVEAMGLTVEWGLLSSAMGTFLGIMLLWAGAGWIRGRPWAAAVTWMYVLAGLTVNVTDMIIFALKAKDGPMRTDMLLLDGVATLIAAGLAAWLLLRRRPASGRPG